MGLSRTRFEGRPLTMAERNIFKPYFSTAVLDQARIIESYVPIWLSHRMDAVVLHHRIYFRQGVYALDSARGIELLGHELTHVSQFLHGMTILKYVWSCRHGYRKSPYEIEAYEKGKMISRICAEV